MRMKLNVLRPTSTRTATSFRKSSRMTIEQYFFRAKEMKRAQQTRDHRDPPASPPTPLDYSDIKAAADVPADSFDMTSTALLHDGRVLTGGNGYRPVMVGHANQRKPARGRASSRTARCEGSHPRVWTKGR
jgi:hypothetical protein